MEHQLLKEQQQQEITDQLRTLSGDFAIRKLAAISLKGTIMSLDAGHGDRMKTFIKTVS